MIDNLQKDVLQSLLHNDLLLNTVKKVFDDEVEKSFPKVNDIDDNLVLGQKYRAYIEARHIISECFNELESYKVEKGDKEGFNKGR